MRLFVVNVGVNIADARRYGLRSPLFPDGTFEFVPIKEHSAFAGKPSILAYRDLRSWYELDRPLTSFIPERLHGYAVHADPEFESFTYGDIESSRASNLRHVQPGDQLWFLARLWRHDGTQWSGESGFHFIGFFEVDANLVIPAGGLIEELPVKVRRRIAGNAHHKRMVVANQAGAFRVLLGHPERSRRFVRAVAVTPEVAGYVYGGSWDAASGLYRNPAGQVLRNRNGAPRRFETFGSITRAVQAFLDTANPDQQPYVEKLRQICADHTAVGFPTPRRWIW